MSEMLKIIRKKKANNRFNNAKSILKKTLPKIEKILEGFENVDEDIDFKNYEVRKDEALKNIRKDLNIAEK
ncbi:MAG: hypothetical protein ACOCRX_10745 [Candidatus Woesearchaeota archaeon]